MSRAFFVKSCFALSISVASFGCESTDTGSSAQTNASSLGAGLGALAAAVNGCAEERDSCEANLADATVDKSCKEAFQSCKKSAIDEAMPDLDKGVNSCAEEARACRKAAADAEEKSACRDALKTCVNEGDAAKGEEHKKVDGGAPNDEQSPVEGCTSALRSCIEGDDETKVCSQALRECLDTTLPHRGKGQEKRPDAGKADEDHGNGKPEEGERGASEEHKPSDAGADVNDGNPSKKPEKAERDGGRGKPQA